MYSVMISSKAKDKLVFAKICLVNSSTILFNIVKGIPYYWFFFLHGNIPVLYSIRFSITPLFTSALESEVDKEQEQN